MTKHIPLTKGKFAIVDDGDYEAIKRFKWRITGNGRKVYAVRSKRIGFLRRKNEYLHRVIMNAQDGEQIDHIDGNGLNCTRTNMRKATHSENLRNRGAPKDNTSGYKGVSFRLGRWRAQIVVNDKQIYLGTFDTPEQAAKAYNEAAVKHHGKFAHINDLSGRE